MYTMTPKPRVIIKSPNMSNVDYQIYQDPKGTCYKYAPRTVDCAGEIPKRDQCPNKQSQITHKKNKRMEIDI